MKKLFIALLIAVLGILIAVSGLHYIQIKNNARNEKQDDEQWVLYENIGTSNVTVVGLQESEDYPYGYNVGKIEDDVVGKAVLITPGTSLNIDNIKIKKGEKLYFSYELHPWVEENSDGAILSICVQTKENKDEYHYNVMKDMNIETIDLSACTDENINIQIQVQNSDNEICDWVILRNFAIADSKYTFNDLQFYDGGYVKSATYFSDEWPLNFWNSELDNLDEDLKQIKGDGFDSIILVIPWREFQPQIAPVSYNEYAFEKLDMIMKAAQENGLGVYTRIGYTWDFYDDCNEDIVNRFCRLLGEKQVRGAWDQYVARMYEVLSGYAAFREGFLTWEDFWNVLGVCDSDSEEDRLQKADYLGYQTWVRNKYKLDDFNKKFATNYESYEDILIPKRDEPAMKTMYAFFDAFLNEILEESQQYFPNLSMEVRLDEDPYYKKNGEGAHYKHKKTFGCANASYTATMYGIPMGFKNVGERVSAEEAMVKTEYILQQLKLNNGNKPVYIEQFIFADNTPKFKDNAQIKKEELNQYLENVSNILLNNSEGYGIWTYRNYCANMIYNAQFALDGKGWTCNDAVNFRQSSGSSICEFHQNGVLEQSIISERNHFDSEVYQLVFDIVNIKEKGLLDIELGTEKQQIEVSDTDKIRLQFNKNDNFNLKFSALNGEFSVDNIKLYSQIQQGFLYDENNQELECIKGIRKLNESLQ